MPLTKNNDGSWTPACEICSWEGEPQPGQGEAQGSYLRHCKTPEHKARKEESEVSPPPGPPSPEGPKTQAPPGLVEKKPEQPPPPLVKEFEGLSDEELVLFHGERGLAFLKRKKLEQLLVLAPSISKSIREWVLRNYDEDSSAQSNPNALYSLLVTSRVPDTFAHRIVQMLMSLENKLRSQPQAPVFMQDQQPPAGQPLFIPGAQRQQNYPVWPQNSQGPYYQQPYPYQYQQPYPYPYQQPYPSPLMDKISSLEKTIEELKKPQPATPEQVKSMVEDVVDRALSRPGVTKEDMTEVFERMWVKREQEEALKAMLQEMKGLREDMKHKSSAVPSHLTEEGSIELKKLDVIGDKIGDIHDTVKTGMHLLLSPESKPKSRSLEDITALDEELSRVSQRVE